MPAPLLPQDDVLSQPAQTVIPGPSQMPSASDAAQFDPARLVDIELPEAVAFWPTAPGWWLLMALVIIILLVAIYFIKRKPAIKSATVKQLKSQAMRELQAIKNNYQENLNDKETTHKTVTKLSVFLRRYALSVYNREQVASLTDQQWLALLDKTYNSQSANHPASNESEPLFSEKYAQLLTQAPYQPVAQAIDHVLLSELFASSEILITKSASLFTQKNEPREKNDV